VGLRLLGADRVSGRLPAAHDTLRWRQQLLAVVLQPGCRRHVRCLCRVSCAAAAAAAVRRAAACAGSASCVCLPQGRVCSAWWPAVTAVLVCCLQPPALSCRHKDSACTELSAQQHTTDAAAWRGVCIRCLQQQWMLAGCAVRCTGLLP
jgi:hypothetical protein